MIGTKAALRKIYMEKRKELHPEQLDQSSNLIIGSLFQHFNFFQLKNIHVFIPINAKFEVNTWPLFNKLSRDFPDIKVIIPKVVGNELEHYVFDRDQLEVGAFGVQEPKGGERFDPKHIELVLIPLLAFDEAGNRVGYGKGYYDHFLAHVPDSTSRVGVSFFPAIEKIVDVNEHDQKLTHCLTPDKFYQF